MNKITIYYHYFYSNITTSSSPSPVQEGLLVFRHAAGSDNVHCVMAQFA